jgi:dienelactone hydrolase
MLRGFAGSGGTFDAHGCNAERDGLAHARDIRAVIEYVVRHPDIVNVDMGRIVVVGQSYGGWNTLAVGTLKVPGVRALVNFAGGRNTPNCPGWQEDLAAASAKYGAATSTPSLWFYGDNDTKFTLNVWTDMHRRYTAAGGPAELVAYGRFMNDAHKLLGMVEGLPIWIPKLDAFLNLRPELMPAPYPAPSQFAAVDDVSAVPLISEEGRQTYRAFLTKDMPRVFVIAPDGTAASTQGGFDPLARALDLCKNAARTCRAYAIDDQVVWPKPVPTPPASQFAPLADAKALPYVNETGRQAYIKFLSMKSPRAFVIAPDSAWVSASRGFDPLQSALESCQKKHQGCQAYAVNDQVVWPVK